MIMERTDVDNIINTNIKDNTARAIAPVNVRTALSAILDWLGNGSSTDLNVSANTIYAIPEGKLLEKIIIIPSAAITAFSVGNSTGASDIMPAVPLDVNTPNLFDLNVYGYQNKSIWFNGITAAVTIKIYLR